MTIRSFIQYLDERVRAKPMTASGVSGDEHVQKFIQPYVGKTDTHTTHREFRDPETKHVIRSGSTVSVHGHENIGGKHHAIVSASGSSQKVKMPISNILKPAEAKNAGVDYEEHLAKNLNKHGVMKGASGGTSSRQDFHLNNKKTGESYRGEAKKDVHAVFGQASLSHHPDKGWHFSDATKRKFPHYTSAAEKATVTVDGKKKPLLQHVNDTFEKPAVKTYLSKKSSKNVYSDHTDLHPVHSYLKDHNVDVLHVGTHGTFRAGHSATNDRTSLGLQTATGTGKFRVREKERGALSVSFGINHMEKSGTDMTKPDHLAKIKEKLGHI